MTVERIVNEILEMNFLKLSFENDMMQKSIRSTLEYFEEQLKMKRMAEVKIRLCKASIYKCILEKTERRRSSTLH